MADWDGIEYRRVNSLQQWLADRALRGLDLTGVQSLLDVGCGDGRITAAIAGALPEARIVGIDPSVRMVAIAPGTDTLTFQVGDVGGMTFEDSFDAVVSFNALHWVRDQHLALSRISTALHAGGRALLVFVCASERASIEDVAMATTEGQTWQRYFTGFQAPYVHPQVTGWTDLAVLCGFAVTGTNIDDLQWDFGSRQAFTHWCTVGFGAWTDRLPAERIDEFVGDVVDRYEAATGSSSVFRFLQMRAELRKMG